MNLWIAKGWCWILRQEPGCQQYTSCSGAAANQHLLLNKTKLSCAFILSSLIVACSFRHLFLILFSSQVWLIGSFQLPSQAWPGCRMLICLVVSTRGSLCCSVLVHLPDTRLCSVWWDCSYICIGEKSLSVRQLDSGQTLPSIPFPCFQTSFVHQLVLRCTCLVFLWKYFSM